MICLQTALLVVNIIIAKANQVQSSKFLLARSVKIWIVKTPGIKNNKEQQMNRVFWINFFNLSLERSIVHYRPKGNIEVQIS